MTARLEWLTDAVLMRAYSAFFVGFNGAFKPAKGQGSDVADKAGVEAMRRVLEAAAQEAETPPQAWLCEQHPFTFWPHGDCAGPGVMVCGCGTCPQCTRPATTEAR